MKVLVACITKLRHLVIHKANNLGDLGKLLYSLIHLSN